MTTEAPPATRESLVHSTGAIALYDVTWPATGHVISARYATTDGGLFPRGLPYWEAIRKCGRSTRWHKVKPEMYRQIYGYIPYE